MINRTVLITLIVVSGTCWTVGHSYHQRQEAWKQKMVELETPDQTRWAALPEEKEFDTPIRLAAGEEEGLVPVPKEQKQKTRTAPETIENPDFASPLLGSKKDNHEVVRKLIEKELPRATESDKEIWYQLLKDDLPEHVVNLLKLRRDFGPTFSSSVLNLDTKRETSSDSDSELPEPFPLGKSETEKQPVIYASDELSRLRSLWKTVRGMALYNIEQLHHPGFKRLEFLGEQEFQQTEATEEAFAIRVQPAGRYRLDLSQGELLQTGNQLDLAIEGPGWFQMVHAETGEKYYTRNGRFRLSAEGELILEWQSNALTLNNSISVPANWQRLEVSEEGSVSVETQGEAELVSLGVLNIVRFPNPTALRYLGDGWYSQTKQSGKPFPNESAKTLIHQKALELSNVNEEREIELLERYHRQWKAGVKLLSEYPPVPSE